MHFLDHWKYWTSSSHFCPMSPAPTEDELFRVGLYNKVNLSFSLANPVAVNTVSRFRRSGYAYDWYRIFSLSDRRFCNYAFGDIMAVQGEPTFTKSRPICSENINNVLLPLNTFRHFKFVTDPLELCEKRDGAVWRGAAYRELRKAFVKKFAGSKLCDVRDTSKVAPRNFFGIPRDFLSPSEQLKYKLIFSIEGNDVASNLKWIMASNSIAVMPRPKFETWFLESLLEPGRHYVEVSEDFSDVEQVVEFYLGRPTLLSTINVEAKRYASKFFNLHREFQLARLVAERYFLFSNNN